jgi:hypothetical protein
MLEHDPNKEIVSARILEPLRIYLCVAAQLPDERLMIALQVG